MNNRTHRGIFILTLAAGLTRLRRLRFSSADRAIDDDLDTDGDHDGGGTTAVAKAALFSRSHSQARSTK